ncbi:MAG: stage II sporulation protein M [Chloroflexota bacterium]
MSYKAWLVVAVAAFAIGILSGLAAPANLAALLEQDLRALQELGSTLSPFHITTALFIYLKNASVLLFSFALGPLFLLFPLLVLVVNGWVIAVVSVEVVKQASLAYLLTGILPHGVVEIPALLLGEAAAFSFGSTLILAFFRRENRAQLRPAVRRSLRYLLVALILFLPAAVIETYLTPWLLG